MVYSDSCVYIQNHNVPDMRVCVRVDQCGIYMFCWEFAATYNNTREQMICLWRALVKPDSHLPPFFLLGGVLNSNRLLHQVHRVSLNRPDQQVRGCLNECHTS